MLTILLILSDTTAYFYAMLRHGTRYRLGFTKTKNLLRLSNAVVKGSFE